MELKKYILIAIFFNFTNFLCADIIKPTKNLTAYDVVKIQLSALKNNNKSNKNDVIRIIGQPQITNDEKNNSWISF